MTLTAAVPDVSDTPLAELGSRAETDALLDRILGRKVPVAAFQASI